MISPLSWVNVIVINLTFIERAGIEPTTPNTVSSSKCTYYVHKLSIYRRIVSIIIYYPPYNLYKCNLLKHEWYILVNYSWTKAIPRLITPVDRIHRWIDRWRSGTSTCSVSTDTISLKDVLLYNAHWMTVAEYVLFAG